MSHPFHFITMRGIAAFAILTLPLISHGQELTIFNPQIYYDGAGGLYDSNFVRHLHVEFEDDNYHSILGESFFTDPSLRIPATVTFDGITLDSVGVRYKGNSTFCLPHEQGNVKVPYNLDMNHWISGQQLMGYNKLKLANAWLDPTYCKEYLASKIYRNYLPTPEVNLIGLHTQGNYTGLYVNTESINKQFLNKHLGENNGVLFKCDGAGVFCSQGGGQGTDGGIPSLEYLGADTAMYYDSYTIKSDDGWEALVDLISTLHFNPEDLHEILNIDRVLWAMAVNTVISNLDTYNGYYVHNYYLYQDVEGRFQMVPWDFDNAFVGAIMGWSYWNPNDVYHFDPFFTGWDAADSRPLTEYLFNHPTYRKQYIAHIRTVMEEWMIQTALQSEIDALQDLAFDAADTDPNSLFSMAQFSSNVDDAFWADWGFGGILATVEARLDFLTNHDEISLAAPALGNMAVNNGIATISTFDSDEVLLMWTAGPVASNFQALTMVDDGTQGDALAGDGTYSSILPGNGDEIKFYVQATNQDAMSLSPARAEYEFYVYSNALAIEESPFANAQYSDWTVVPNPVNDAFYLKGCEPGTEVMVMDYQGRIMLQQQWIGQAFLVGDWSPGIYLVSTNKGGNPLTRKLCIR
ncbi:MAG: CotH kinase family protein [Flavobacteriales bacterium]